MTVKTTHASYAMMVDEWAKCRAAAIGERAIHEAGELYLPKLKEEAQSDYNARLKMTPWFNATWRTIDGLRGIMFRKPPKVEAAATLIEEFKDIDLAGSDLDTFAQEVAEEALTVGRVGLMVDYPVVQTDAATQADVQAMGFRPFVSMYKAETIINWKTSRAHGATVLSMVVLKEQTDLPGETEFDVVVEERYRVLDLFEGKYRQRVFKIEDKVDVLLEEFFPLLNNQPLNFIPFMFIGVDTTRPAVDDPPLIDLVNTNFKHYGQATSYERGCFFSGLPTLFISGLGDSNKPIYIGGNVANALESENAKAYYVEIQGNFEALRNNLEDKKREMAILGARMLEVEKQGVEAEGTIARRQVGEESILSAMAQNISRAITQALRWYADWKGSTEEVVFEINRAFLPANMDAATLTALMAAWVQGGISKETLFNKLQQGEIIGDNVTFEEEEAKISIQAPTLAGEETL